MSRGGNPDVQGGASSVRGGASSSGATAQGGLTSGGASSSGGTGSASAGFGGTTASGGRAPGTGGAAFGGSAVGGTASGGSAVGGTASGRGGAGGAASGGNAAGGNTSGGNAAGGVGSSGKGAPEAKAIGYGRNATGAGSMTAKTVASFAAAQAAIDAYSGSGGLALLYTGKVRFESITDPCTQHSLPAQILEIKKKSDITLLGADGSAADFGVHIAAASSNIVIRNMTFGLLAGGDASDAISIEGMSGGVPQDIWIDHNEFFSSMADCPGAGDTAFDGLIDVKKGADNITVSYNYIHEHHKVSLNGFSDSDSAVRHITFYRNVFEDVGSRTPLQRGGYSHIVNNLFSGIRVSGINVRMGGYTLIESNFFEDAKNPVTSRDSDELGDWELRNNNLLTPADFAKFGISWGASDSTPTKDATDWVTTKPYPLSLGYPYAPVAPQCLKQGLKAVAGAGKGLATLQCD